MLLAGYFVIIIVSATNARFLTSSIVAGLALTGVTNNADIAAILGAWVISLVLTVVRD